MRAACSECYQSREVASWDRVVGVASRYLRSPVAARKPDLF